MNKTGHTCQQVLCITGLNQRQLSYWRKTGPVQRIHKNITLLMDFPQKSQQYTGGTPLNQDIL